MYLIPVTNSPNQTFQCNIPVGDKNILMQFNLWYNDEAKYWLISARDVKADKELFSNLPMLSSGNDFFNILNQLGYKEIGSLFVAPINGDRKSMPDDTDLGTIYKMVWGDTNEW